MFVEEKKDAVSEFVKFRVGNEIYVLEGSSGIWMFSYSSFPRKENLKASLRAAALFGRSITPGQ